MSWIYLYLKAAAPPPQVDAGRGREEQSRKLLHPLLSKWNLEENLSCITPGHASRNCIFLGKVGAATKETL